MKDFTAALLAAIQQAEAECGVCQPRLKQRVETCGGVSAAKDYIRHHRVSDGFDALTRIGRPELSMEALLVQSAWQALFADEEVNACFDLLCSIDYFTKRRT